MFQTTNQIIMEYPMNTMMLGHIVSASEIRRFNPSNANRWNLGRAVFKQNPMRIPGTRGFTPDKPH